MTDLSDDHGLKDLVHRIFMAGYECGKKQTGLQMVIASDVIEPAAVAEMEQLLAQYQANIRGELRS